MIFQLRKKLELTPEQIKHQQEMEALKNRSAVERDEAIRIGTVLREIREENHFAKDFRKALGG